MDDLPDLDEVFAYDTVKEVKVLDRRLGVIYYLILASVIFYIVIFVFMIKKQYLDREKTSGWVIPKVINPAHTKDANLPFDLFDSVTNPGEQGAAFLPTRILVTKGQAQEDFCPSPSHKCKSAEDCDIGNDALQKKECVDGFCNRRGWCPPMKHGDPKTEEILINTEKYDVW